MLVCWLALLASPAAVAKLPELLLPTSGLRAEQLAVVINTRDASSWQLADYYRKRHGIPARNMIHIAFDPGKAVVHPGEFAVMKRVLDAKTPKYVQAFVLTWAQPYRVGCMSITSAFAFGFDARYCARGCQPTAVSEYARSASQQPYTDLGIRPTMMLATETFSQAKALVNRAIISRGWYFKGPNKRPAAYLVETPDRNRSVRKVFFPAVKQQFGDLIDVHIEQSEGIEGADDILFYFTGDRFVKGLHSNHYLPGAVADHLTSSGGRLTNSTQMSAMEWLKAGATGSYGTVVEPCNILSKFPNPERLMAEYLAGRTLMEAYWKSVLMPGQGVFIGDPLAAPFQGYRMIERGDYIEVYTAQLAPGSYRLRGGDSADGPFLAMPGQVTVGKGIQQFRIAAPYARYYQLVPSHELQYQPGEWLP